MTNTKLPEIFDENLAYHRQKNIHKDDFLLKEIFAMNDERIAELSLESGSGIEPQSIGYNKTETRNKFDYVKSTLQIHKINDVSNFLHQAKDILHQDGFLVANFFGGETLHQLRKVFLLANNNAAYPHIHPMIDIRDAGYLLQQAGFALPVADSYKINVEYSNLFDLMHHIKRMGENNCLIKRHKKFLGKDYFSTADKIYKSNFGTSDNTIIATYEIITITGYRPSPKQPKPLLPGSAEYKLKDFL